VRTYKSGSIEGSSGSGKMKARLRKERENRRDGLVSVKPARRRGVRRMGTASPKFQGKKAGRGRSVKRIFDQKRVV